MDTDVTYRHLYVINRDGNASSPYESEMVDDWLPEASYTGKDCDSYATWKKRAILRLDWDLHSRMAICTCWVETGEYHAVLLCAIAGKVYVLDNRKHYIESVRHFESLGYRFHKVPEYMQVLVAASEAA